MEAAEIEWMGNHQLIVPRFITALVLSIACLAGCTVTLPPQNSADKSSDVIDTAMAEEESSRSFEPPNQATISPERLSEAGSSPEFIKPEIIKSPTKGPEPAKQASTPESVNEGSRSPELMKPRNKSPEPAKQVSKSPESLNEAGRSPEFIKSLTKAPEPAKVVSTPHEPARELRKSSEERSDTANSLLKRAEAGNLDAQNELGLLYLEGRGVPQNFERASLWFGKAAEQGHAGAQVNLGTLYFLGQGVSGSNQQALFWFRKAAAQRDALAFAKLGRMYELGRGVPQDLIQAHMWYNLSVAHGERQAAEARDALAKQMNPRKVAEAQRLAIEWKPSVKL